MSRTTCIRSAILALAVTAPLLPLGCRHVDNPVGPALSSSTLRTIWPNDDGRYWTYEVASREVVGPVPHYYSVAESVPPAPSLVELERLVGSTPVSIVGSGSSSLLLQFRGMKTTESGAVGQNLSETYLTPTSGLRSSAVTPVGNAFLAQLLRARPDLRPRLAARISLASIDAAAAADARSLFLFGYAWKKTADWIGTYGDLDTLLAWKYLIANLRPGSEFTHQLVPLLASDIYLHGRILNPRTVRTPAGVFRRATICLYLVDYGISGGSGGYYRWYSYGAVAYADGVGPVASRERLMSPDGGFEELSLALTGTGIETQARASRADGRPSDPRPRQD
jgi:hypothetical protein